MKIILPFHLPKNYPITQKFGEKFMYEGKICSHKGVDYGLPRFTPIIAPFDGKVIRTTPERDYGYGKAVYLQAKDNKKNKVIALMAHLDSISVKSGYNVKMSDRLGVSGRSGFWRGRNGYHLHLGLEVNNHYIDPLVFMNKEVEQTSSLFEDQDDAKLKCWLGKYEVKKDDTLWDISIKYYGKGNCGHFMEIFNANQDILEKPNLIHPGDILRIPAIKDKGL